MSVLPARHIPGSLWSEGKLSLPSSLAAAYRSELEKRGLYTASLRHVSGAVHGGPTKEDTDLHFAGRFVNSASRALYALLSPCGTFGDVSDTFISALSYGNVAILDVPCGTGALSSAVLSLLIELRQEKVVPTLPLTLSICAGDYSEPSREVCDSMLGALSREASTVGIAVTYDVVPWDALNAQDTAELVDRWFAASTSASDHLVMILNFSGDMHKAETFSMFSPSLNQILSRLYNRKGAVLWLEPATRNARRDLRDRFVDFVGRAPYLRNLVRRGGADDGRHAEYEVRHPFQDASFPTNVMELCFYPYLPRGI